MIKYSIIKKQIEHYFVIYIYILFIFLICGCKDKTIENKTWRDKTISIENKTWNITQIENNDSIEVEGEEIYAGEGKYFLTLYFQPNEIKEGSIQGATLIDFIRSKKKPDIFISDDEHKVYTLKYTGAMADPGDSTQITQIFETFTFEEMPKNSSGLRLHVLDIEPIYLGK